MWLGFVGGWWEVARMSKNQGTSFDLVTIDVNNAMRYYT
jgi:hypothetical protein